jgi:hypothetical protein
MVVAMSKPALNIPRLSRHAPLPTNTKESIMVDCYHRLTVRGYDQLLNRISTQEQIMRSCILLVADGSLAWFSAAMVG